MKSIISSPLVNIVQNKVKCSCNLCLSTYIVAFRQVGMNSHFCEAIYFFVFVIFELWPESAELPARTICAVLVFYTTSMTVNAYNTGDIEVKLHKSACQLSMGKLSSSQVKKKKKSLNSVVNFILQTSACHVLCSHLWWFRP